MTMRSINSATTSSGQCRVSSTICSKVRDMAKIVQPREPRQQQESRLAVNARGDPLPNLKFGIGQPIDGLC
jgi:hypothetical protein